MRTLGGILATDSTADVTRLGWPTLRAGFPLMTVLNSCARCARCWPDAPADETPPVMAVIGAGPGSGPQHRRAEHRARRRARRRQGAVDRCRPQGTRAVGQGEPPGQQRAQPFRLAQHRRQGARAIETANGISILPAVNVTDAKACDAIRKAIAQARSTGGYDLVIIDGPAMPWSPTDRKLLDMTEGLVPILPVHLDINDSMEDIIAALGGTERKLVGVVLSEVDPTAVEPAAGQAICVSVAQIPSGERPRPAYLASHWAGCGLPCWISSRPRTS